MIGSSRKKKFQSHVSLAIRDETQEGAISIPVLVPKKWSCLQWCYLGAWIEVEGSYDYDEQRSADSASDDNGGQKDTQSNHKCIAAKDNNNKRPHMKSSRLELIQCAPDPNAVLLCLDLVARQELHLHVFSRTYLENLHQVTKILEFMPRDVQRKEVAKLVRQLEGRDSKRVSAQRIPHTRKRHLELLERLEQVIPVMEIQPDTAEGEPPSSTSNGSNNNQLVAAVDPANLPVLNLPVGSENESSRVEYLRRKKLPQIQYFVQRLARLDSIGKINDTTKIIDVGGGRGDLGTALALAFPHTHVTVVDKNESSLRGGESFAQQLGIITNCVDKTQPSISFHCVDFAEFMRDYRASENENIVVVALHACGDLSDLALDFAHRFGADFIICPCCYTKRYVEDYEPLWVRHVQDIFNAQCQQVDADKESSGSSEKPAPSNNQPHHVQNLATVQRLAELNERPAIALRAMKTINTLRLCALQRKSDSEARRVLQLEKYDSTYSRRNIVLVGQKS